VNVWFLGSVVGIMTGTRAGRSNAYSSKRYYSSPKVQTGSGAYPASSLVCTADFPGGGVKRPGSEVNCSSEVKNKWNYTPATQICLHGVDREMLPFTVSVTFS